MKNKVEKYFSVEGNSPSSLAGKIGCAPSTITRSLKGEREPSFSLAKEVDRVTDGAIPALDFIAVCMSAKATPKTKGAA